MRIASQKRLRIPDQLSDRRLNTTQFGWVILEGPMLLQGLAIMRISRLVGQPLPSVARRCIGMHWITRLRVVRTPMTMCRRTITIRRQFARLAVVWRSWRLAAPRGPPSPSPYGPESLGEASCGPPPAEPPSLGACQPVPAGAGSSAEGALEWGTTDVSAGTCCADGVAAGAASSGAPSAAGGRRGGLGSTSCGLRDGKGSAGAAGTNACSRAPPAAASECPWAKPSGAVGE